MSPRQAANTAQAGNSWVAVPSQERLARGLANALGEPEAALLAREPNPYTSTFPSETVTLRTGGPAPVRVFCKYGPTVYESGHGHRGSVAYEAAVYRDVLTRASVTVPRFVGEHAEDGVTWLIIEPIEPSTRLERVPIETGLLRAAGWLGRLHAQFEGERLGGLKIHDARYYGAWARRTLRFAGPLRRRLPWLTPLCRSYLELVPAFSARPRTLVHGEFTVHNVLASQGSVYPVDWQSAAAGTGEEDLAMLIDGWPQDTAEACQREYVQERWPGGPPIDSRWALEVASLYAQLRWLGNSRDWTHGPKASWRFERLEETGTRLALV